MDRRKRDRLAIFLLIIGFVFLSLLDIPTKLANSRLRSADREVGLDGILSYLMREYGQDEITDALFDSRSGYVLKYVTNNMYKYDIISYLHDNGYLDDLYDDIDYYAQTKYEEGYSDGYSDGYIQYHYIECPNCYIEIEYRADIGNSPY